MSDPKMELQFESSAFGDGDTRLQSLRGREAISRLFSFELVLVHAGAAPPDPSSLVGTEASVVFLRDGFEVRRIHGMLAEVRDRLDTIPNTRTYLARLVPCAFQAALVETQEVFVDATVPAIVTQKLELAGLAEDVELRLDGSYGAREFVVQYAETDLAFISRLAEHLGISFFFEQRDGREKLVLTDHASGFSRLEGDHLAFRGRGEARDVFAIERVCTAVPGAYVVYDYNYRLPSVDLSSTFELESGIGGGVVEHGAHFKTPDEGSALARIRGEEGQSRQSVYEGQSDLVELRAGGTFVLDGHPVLKDNHLLLVEVEHAVTQNVSIDMTGEEQPYRNSFRAVPAAGGYRPPRVTPRPKISGVVTGIVASVAEGSAAAPIDEQGRYLVRLLFDTARLAKDKPSRPIRIASPHAGAGYGIHFPLRPGTEVLLAFVNGDPDRPIIVGAVHNALSPSPVTIANAESHVIRTASGAVIDMS